jgi:hypothetical protein
MLSCWKSHLRILSLGGVLGVLLADGNSARPLTIEPPRPMPAVIIADAAPMPLQPLTVQRLRDDAQLTPERFMAYFCDFEFKLGDVLQSPEVFLATKSGDCDDFATLAADILNEKKYTTRLVAVFMDSQTHVVCYVEEIKGYLDFNLRNQSITVQPSNGDLDDIAGKVAKFFRADWRYVSEFTYQSGTRRFGRIAFH